MGYLVPAYLIVWLNDPERNGAGFWPAAGVSVAILLLSPTRMWLWALAGIGLAELVSDLVNGYPVSGIPWWTAGNLIDPLLGAFLVRRFAAPNGRLLPLRNMLLFIGLAVIAGPLVGASVGSVGTVTSFGLSWGEVWPKYVAGDALGVLVVAPVILTWREAIARRSAGEWLVVGSGLLLVSLAGFAEELKPLHLIFPYFLIPFLTWAGLRFGMRGAAWAVFGVAQAMNVTTAFGHGPFVRFTTSGAEAVTMEQLFLIIASSATFVLAAVASELSDRDEVERLLGELGDSMPQLVWVAADGGAIAYWNRRQHAYVAPHAHGAELQWPDLVHPDDLERTLRAWRVSEASDDVFEHEHRLCMADGSYRWHLSRAERVQALDGARWYGTSTDIHAMKLAEDEKDQFIAIASHELRNPVGAVHGIAQLLARSRDRGNLTQERLVAYIDPLLESTTYLARLTNDLMDVSRLQGGGLALQTEPADIATLLESVVELEQWPAGRIQNLVTGDHGSIEVDPARLQQVLANLIDNALKYSPSEELVEIRARQSGDQLCIEVVDRGIGIPPDALEHIFEPFGRAQNTAGIPGLGMGLYVARQIVEHHRGQLLAIPNPSGPGTAMRLLLPAAPHAAAPRPASAAPESVGLPAPLMGAADNEALP